MKIRNLVLISLTCLGALENPAAAQTQDLRLADASRDDKTLAGYLAADEKNAPVEAKTATASGGKTTAENAANVNYCWEFVSALPKVFDELVLQDAGHDDLGQRTACLKALVDKYYIHKEEVVPGDPTMRTIIRKPSVYNTLRRIEKHIRKEVKKGRLDKQIAANDLNYVLEVAIAVVDEKDTGGFEDSLETVGNNIDRQIGLFKQVKLNNLY